jgi:hypothetical protein
LPCGKIKTPWSRAVSGRWIAGGSLCGVDPLRALIHGLEDWNNDPRVGGLTRFPQALDLVQMPVCNPIRKRLVWERWPNRVADWMALALGAEGEVLINWKF